MIAELTSVPKPAMLTKKRQMTKPSSGLLSARPKPGTTAATDSSSALLVRVHGAVKQGQGWLHSLEEARIFAREINALTTMPVGIDVQQYVADWYNWQRWQTRSGWPLEPKCDRPAGQPMPGRPVFGFGGGAMRMPSFGGGMLAPAHALHYGALAGGMNAGMLGGLPGSARLGLGMPGYDPRAQAHAQQLAMERAQLESERQRSAAHLERQRQELEAQRSALGGMMSMVNNLSSNLTSSVSQAFKGAPGRPAGVPENGELRAAGQPSGARPSGRSGKKHHHQQQHAGERSRHAQGVHQGYNGHGGYPPESYAAQGYDPRYGPPVSTRYSGAQSSQRRMPFLPQQQALESAQGQAMTSQRASAQEMAPDGQPYLRLPFGHFGGRSVESV